jgi:hypothetical protein
MNEAIKLAIEKGGFGFGDFFLSATQNKTLKWRINEKFQQVILWDSPDYRESDVYKFSFNDVAMMSSFWQALGKALKWKIGPLGQPLWLYYAHRYFDSVLTGGDQEKFWNQLIGEKI